MGTHLGVDWTPPTITGHLPRHRAGVHGGWEGGNVARGLVPRWGRGGAWQNPPCQLAIPNHNSGFSHLGVPAPAGMIHDWYENSIRRPRECPHITGLALANPPPVRHSRAGGNPRTNPPRQHANRDTGKHCLGQCSAVEDYARRGACPPLGSRWGNGVTDPAPIRHSRAGGNPRTFPPPKNVNRDTTNYDHTDTPESGFPIGYSGDVMPLPDPAPDSTAGGGANHTRIPSPCGTVHRGHIVKARDILRWGSSPTNRPPAATSPVLFPLPLGEG